MSGLTIDHGGVISVDPDELRDAARRLDRVASRIDAARVALDAAQRIIVDTPGFSAYVDIVLLWGAVQHASSLAEECREAVSSTLLMADVYEYVELRAEAEMLAHTDPAAADRLSLRAERLGASDDRIPTMAAQFEAAWRTRRFEGLVGNPVLPGLYGDVFGLAALVGVFSGFGKILPGEMLSGRADRVTVAPVKTSSPSSGPAGLAAAFGRMPTAEGAQVAVEKYSYSDGRTRYVAYLKGTQSVGWGGREPWDLKSNAELYTNRRSASYQATLDALAAAGADAGDEVDVVAHSQSGMVTGHLSMESEFDVRVQITAGSPVEPTLDPDQTLVQLRHTDDPVSALAGGGSPEGTGSSDSVTLSREGDPLNTIEDIWVDTHLLHSYTETAEMADASGDPRVEALDEFWDDLSDAEIIERTEYHAERVQ
ncbi:hypothetical protein DXT68_16195 [Microbacterium foliorum]|uniref:Alpha/beta hydrolase n=1 Tax=Microbacterium foliorum TaxID=104336 RepID=A0A0F0KXL5_9MICO|nr:hypothetical protein [Microbacterium foliorum]AXL13495.1 hypothetical protein DXT68_16195 [Microbacterium foliorum]KJL25652.1 hypothetical protein RN50_00422 [Microbacterium foliorum]